MGYPLRESVPGINEGGRMKIRIEMPVLTVSLSVVLWGLVAHASPEVPKTPEATGDVIQGDPVAPGVYEGMCEIYHPRGDGKTASRSARSRSACTRAALNRPPRPHPLRPIHCWNPGAGQTRVRPLAP